LDYFVCEGCEGSITCNCGCLFQRITLSVGHNARCLSTGRVLAGKQVYTVLSL